MICKMIMSYIDIVYHSSGQLQITTAPLLTGFMVFRGESSPFMAYLFRLVIYYNLPRWL